MNPRVALVGAGPGGLVCAAHLLAGGAEVTVLEQAATGYGGLSSFEGPLPGFHNDICAGFLPLTRAAPAFRAASSTRKVPVAQTSWVASGASMLRWTEGRAAR